MVSLAVEVLDSLLPWTSQDICQLISWGLEYFPGARQTIAVDSITVPYWYPRSIHGIKTTNRTQPFNNVSRRPSFFFAGFMNTRNVLKHHCRPNFFPGHSTRLVAIPPKASWVFSVTVIRLSYTLRMGVYFLTLGLKVGAMVGYNFWISSCNRASVDCS